MEVSCSLAGVSSRIGRGALISSAAGCRDDAALPLSNGAGVSKSISEATGAMSPSPSRSREPRSCPTTWRALLAGSRRGIGGESSEGSGIRSRRGDEAERSSGRDVRAGDCKAENTATVPGKAAGRECAKLASRHAWSGAGAGCSCGVSKISGLGDRDSDAASATEERGATSIARSGAVGVLCASSLIDCSAASCEAGRIFGEPCALAARGAG
jgi:hypothetical protein